MARKDITDVQVCLAYQKRGKTSVFVNTILEDMTRQHRKVCFAAMERACGRGLVEFGVSLRTGWLTDKGKALLKQHSLLQPD